MSRREVADEKASRSLRNYSFARIDVSCKYIKVVLDDKDPFLQSPQGQTGDSP